MIWLGDAEEMKLYLLVLSGPLSFSLVLVNDSGDFIVIVVVIIFILSVPTPLPSPPTHITNPPSLPGIGSETGGGLFNHHQK